MERLKGLILSGRHGHAPAPDHPHERQAARAGRQQPGALLRHRGDGRRPGSRRSGSSSRPRPATRSARRPATARSSACGSPTSSRTSPPGLAHAVLTAEPFLGDDPFVMYLGDNLLQGGITDLVDAFRANEPDALILLTPVPDPEHYGVAELDGDRVVAPGREAAGAEDRPRARRRLHVHRRRSTTPRARSSPRARGELEITDAIQHLVDSGRRVEPHIVRGLVEGHRPPRGHARGQPADPRHASSTRVDGELDRLAGRRPRRRRGGRAARALDRPRPGDHRRRRAPASTAYIGPYTAIGEDCVDRARRGRALDPARRLARSATSTARMESSLLGPQRARSRATTASRAPTASWSATTPRSGSSDVRLARHRRRRDARPGRRRGRASARPRGRRRSTRAELDITDARAVARASSRATRPTRSSTAPPGPTSTAPRTDEDARARGQRRRRRQRRARRGRAPARALVARLDRLRLRRRRRPSPYVESDPTGPRSAYGRTKLAGERAVAAAGADHAIVRTSWLFGAGGAQLRRHDAARSAPSATRCSVVDRPGRLPDLDRPPRAGAARRSPSAATPGIFHVAGGGHVLLVRASRVEIFAPGRASTCRVLPTTTDASSPRPRRARPGQRARHRARPTRRALPAWQDGLRRLSRTTHGGPRMKLLVCGGAGFIGSNFVRLRVREHGDEVVVLDKLTYAGRRENLAGPRRRRFVARRDRGPRGRRAARSRASTRSSTSPPRRTSTARSPSPTRSSRTHARRHLRAARGGARARACATCRSRPTRSTARSRRARSPRTSPLQPVLALQRDEGRRRPARRSPTSTPTGCETVICRGSNNYGPYQYPEKLIPLMVLNALHGDPLPVYGDGMQVRNWIYVEDFARGDRPRARARRARRGLQRRRPRRVPEHRGRQAHHRADRAPTSR